MLFYLDENVPASVEVVIAERGHDVAWTRDILPIGAPDELVGSIAENDRALLVSHDKDFKRIAPRIPEGERTRFRNLSMIRMECIKPRSAQRMGVALPYIEFEYNERDGQHDQRIIIAVKTDLISIWR